MREIVVDTETTGLDPSKGHKIVEIGCVELSNHMPTGRIYHQYINPEREVAESAVRVHGLTTEFLERFPIFAEIADELLEFIGDAVLIFHNAPFDTAFLNAELSRSRRELLDGNRVIDTLEMARARFPGAQNSLDALCRRFNIDRSSRSTAHGASIDAELLARVYLELMGGRQPTLGLQPNSTLDRNDLQEVTGDNPAGTIRLRPRALPNRLSQAESDAHREFVRSLGENSVWKTVFGYPDG